MKILKIQTVVQCAAAVAISGSLSFASLAQESLEGRIILEAFGEISSDNSEGSVLFDIEKLEALGLHEVTTETPWTNGTLRFQGVLGRDLLEYIEASGTTITATAINDYSVEIPVSDFYDYDAIFATRLEGKLMSVRDRGPIWIIYPWSSTPDIQNEVYYSRSIWQLDSVTVFEN